QQGLGAELGNAIGRAIVNTPISIVSNVGAILDIEDYWNKDKEIGNWLTNAAEEAREKVGKALPVYQQPTSDMGSKEWWINNGSDLASSMAGFVGTGYGMGAALGWLGKLGKTGQYASTAINAIGL